MPVCYLKQKRMINKQLITRRFSRAVESYNREAVAQKQIAYRMSDMLNHYLPRPCGRILEIGSGTGFLTRRLMETLHPEKLVLNDICQEMSSCFTDLLALCVLLFLFCLSSYFPPNKKGHKVLFQPYVHILFS